MSEQPENQFAIQRIYVKDSSFETPMGVKAFQQNWQPQINQDINTRANSISEDVHEVVLTITITATLGEGEGKETCFIAEIQQAGIFLLKGMDDERKKRLLGTMCPNILFPYAREAVDSLVTKGSFPPLLLPPINFDVLYQQALAQQQAGDKPQH